MRGAILAVLFALFAGPAFAWTHGLATTTGSVNVGADTPVQFGGISYAALGYGGAPGTLTVTSDTGSGGPSTIWAFDADNNLVACKNAAAECGSTTYGGAKPTWAGPYAVTLSGTGFLRTVTINVVSGVANWQYMCTSLSGTACVDVAGHPDTATSNQLRTLTNTHWAGAESLLQRDTGTGGVLPNIQYKALIFNNSGSAPYGGQILIGAESTANPPPAAPMCWDSTSAGDVDLNLNFSYLNFQSYGVGPSGIAPMVGNCSSSLASGYDVQFHHITAGLGFGVNTIMVGVDVVYEGTCGGAPSCDFTVTDSYFYNLKNGIVIEGAVTTSPVGAILTRNFVQGTLNDLYHIFVSPDNDVEYNTAWFPNPSYGNHPDCIQMTTSSIGQTGSQGTYKYNVCVRNSPGAGTQIGTMTVANAGIGYTAGTYAGVIATGGSGSGANLTIVIGGGGTVTSASASNDNGGVNYAVNDTLSLPATCCGGGGSGGQLTVASLTGNLDFQGPPFFHQTGTDHFNGITSSNNIYVGTYGNCNTFDAVDNIVSQANDCIQDVQAAAAGPVLLSSRALVVAPASKTSVNANFDHDLTNGWSIAGVTGTVTCAPASAPSCTALALTNNLTNYAASFLQYDQSTACTGTNAQIRACFISRMIPSTSTSASNIARNSDGTYNGTLTPQDSNGVPCFNEKVTGSWVVFDVTKTCAAQGLGPAS